ncbi:TPA: TniQ family protein [Neisseria subflava]
MILPAHPKPYPDELFTSWLVRLAHANGLKVQTFCHLLFPNYEIWNRDIDRHTPDWLVNTLAEKTGCSTIRIKTTTLDSLQGRLFDKNNFSGQLTWINSLKANHRKRDNNAIVYCPLCLATDNETYFRKSWRIALYTFCPIHQIMMHDCCPKCGIYVAFHRQDLGKPNLQRFTELKYCWNCQYDLSNSPCENVIFFNDEIRLQWQNWLNQIANLDYLFNQSEKEQLKILHHFLAITTSKKLAPDLYSYLCKQIHQIPVQLERSRRLSWESRSLAERHSTIHACLWLMQNFPKNLFQAWQDKVVRYNHLLKDFNDCPQIFRRIVSKMNRNVYKELYYSEFISY